MISEVLDLGQEEKVLVEMMKGLNDQFAKMLTAYLSEKCEADKQNRTLRDKLVKGELTVGELRKHLRASKNKVWAQMLWEKLKPLDNDMVVLCDDRNCIDWKSMLRSHFLDNHVFSTHVRDVEGRIAAAYEQRSQQLGM
jgi:hypothetical protein